MTLLTEIGLTENETKVYTALLDKGSLPVNRIYEETGINRRNVYDVLNKLISKGLATYVIENKKKVFQATDPKRIITFLEEQKRLVEEKEELARKKLPELEKKFLAKTSAIEAEIYRGFEGIKTIWEDSLNYKEMFFIGAAGYLYYLMPRYWIVYNRKRKKVGLKWFVLATHEMRGTNIPPLTDKLIKSKYLPKELSGPPNVIWIYGNKVANVLWTDTPLAFVVNDKEMAESYRKYFYFLWNKVAKK